MPVPIQPVTSFSESELWYMYQQLTEINANTSGGGGLSQTELYEVFNGTNSQGFAVSLFESLSGSDTPLANLLVETTSGTNISAANLLYDSYLKLSSINTNTGNSATSLSNIETYTSGTATNCAAINTNTANTTTAVQTSNTYFSVLRTPVILSTSGSSAGINAQIHNIAFANVGAAAGTITVNGTTVSLPVGAVVEYNAGGLNNRFAVNSFGYNGTGTTLLIQYVN